MKYPKVPLSYWHEKLWEKTDHRGRVKLNIKEWAKELARTEHPRGYDTIHYFVERLRTAGRIRKVAEGRNRLATYEVVPPDQWHPDMPRRPLRWG